MNARAVFACLLLATLAGCSSLSKVRVADADVAAARYVRSGDLAHEVDALAQPLIDAGQTPGIVVGVLLPDGSRRFYGYGAADDAGTRPAADTLFAVGSVTKGFVGALTAMLVQDGVLRWNDTVRDLLPPDVPLSDDAARITVRELATHTSGLPRQPATLEVLSLFTQYLFTGRDFYRTLDRDAVYAYLGEWSAPGGDDRHAVRYSNIGYALLGHLIERRTGRDVASLIDERLVAPLRLTHTGFTPDTLDRDGRARGHAGDQPKFIRRGTPQDDWRMNRFMIATGGIYSSARDLLEYAAAHVQPRDGDGRLDLSPLLQPPPGGDTTIAWLEGLPGQPIRYQFGVIAGFSSFVGVDPEHRTAVVVLQNSFNWTDRIGHNLLVRLAIASELQTAAEGSTGSPRVAAPR